MTRQDRIVPERMAPSTEAQMNRSWFELHEHLTNEEMLAHGLIDRCDLIWVEALRQIEPAIHAAEHDGYPGDEAHIELATLCATVEAQAKQIETLRAVLKECKRIVGIYDIVPLIEDVLSSAPSVPIGVPVEEQTSECCEKWRTRNADIASYTLGAVVLSGARFKFCPDCGKPLGGA